MTHPIKAIRQSAHLSQREAASIAGVTEQVILKVEQGVYPTLPLSIVKAFASIDGTVTQEELEYRYEYWIDSELRKVKLPPIQLTTDSSVGDFVIWRSHLCKLNDVTDTQMSVAKLLKINPYVIQKWEGGKMKQIPMQVLERIAYIKGEF